MFGNNKTGQNWYRNTALHFAKLFLMRLLHDNFEIFVQIYNSMGIIGKLVEKIPSPAIIEGSYETKDIVQKTSAFPYV